MLLVTATSAFLGIFLIVVIVLLEKWIQEILEGAEPGRKLVTKMVSVIWFLLLLNNLRFISDYNSWLESWNDRETEANIDCMDFEDNYESS